MERETSRFGILINSLPVFFVKRILEVGCGDKPSTALLVQRFPDALIVGVDYDLSALHRVRVPMQSVLADVRALPFGGQFDLIVCRHPDVDRFPESWAAGFERAVTLLSPDGILLITCYSIPELDWLHKQLKAMSLKRLDHGSTPDLTGRDRFVMMFRF